jgi:hypothetical protein
MSCLIPWMAAEREESPEKDEAMSWGRKPPQRVVSLGGDAVGAQTLPAHQFPPREKSVPRSSQFAGAPGHPVESLNVFPDEPRVEEQRCDQHQRRMYRTRTVAMLRRYMRCSLETGRLPSLLGSEFFRAKVSTYTVGTFEDRVIFVHDMESCLERLDEFSRQLIARPVLQEHDCTGTARLLHCNEKTVRRLTPLALDRLSEILIDRGLMEAIDADARNSCQVGEEAGIALSDWEDGENKF